MDKLKNVEHAEHLIRTYFPIVDRTLAKGNIADFARIAFFLEQPAEVITELKKLEAVLQERFIQKYGTFDPNPKTYISAEKTKGLLTSYLNEWDSQFGFNSLSDQTTTTFPMDFSKEKITIDTQGTKTSPSGFDQLPKLPTGRTPTITGFAAPNLFRLALLRLGYHWKDPGAGDVHGDITHRLQWFAITSAYRRIGVGVNPLYLFQKLGSPETWNPQFQTPYSTGSAGRALWDFVCDCFVEKLQDDPVGPRSTAESYRSPVTLQRDLTTKCTNSDELPLLRRIINRKKLAIRDKVKNLPGRQSVAVIDYVGPEKTSVMDGQVAFYLKN
jgi:hypothetical protein